MDFMIQRLKKESNEQQCVLHDTNCFSLCFYNTGIQLTGRYSQLVETPNPVTSAAVSLIVGACVLTQLFVTAF
jgi:hypothetical protein